MVVGPFPVVKLGFLLLKQISKPIANVLKERAKSRPVFRTYVCMPPAQFYNWCEVKMKMWILNLGKPVNIPVLNEAMAIELGANLLGESFIFIIAAGAILAEYTRSSRKEAAKETARVEELESLKDLIQELYVQTQQQDAQIRELSRSVGDLDSRVIRKPWALKKSDEKEPPESPPPSPQTISPVVATKTTLPSTPTSMAILSSPKSYPYSVDNLLFSAIKIVENDFWKNDENEQNVSILTMPLNHLFNEVYKLPIRLQKQF